MGRMGVFRRTLLLCLLVSILLPALPLLTHAQEEPVISPAPPDRSFEGVYQVSGSTDTGAGVDATVIVRAIGDELIQFRSRIRGIPITVSGPPTWTGPDEVTVPVSQRIRGVGSGSGTVTLTRAAAGWEFFASGSGMIGFTSGTATASGFGGGVAPTRTEVSEVTAVSETVLAVDEAADPVKPAAEHRDLDTDDTVRLLAVILFAMFVWFFLALILGSPIPVV